MSTNDPARPLSRRLLLSGGAGALAVAGSAVTPVLATAGIGDDTEIEALIAAYRMAQLAHDEAEKECGEAHKRFKALGGVPEHPEAVYVRPGDAELCLYGSFVMADGRKRFADSFIDGSLRTKPRMKDGLRWVPVPAGREREYFMHRRMHEGVDEFGVTISFPSPEAQARADEIVAAWDAFVREADRRLAASGVEQADAADDDAYEAEKAAREAVLRAPAQTMRGVALKAAVVMSWFEDMADLTDEISDDTHLAADSRLSLSIVRDLISIGGREA